MMDTMPATKRAVGKKRAKPTSTRLPKRARAKKVRETVLSFVNGKPTDEKRSGERAFSDLEQAREQVLYAERHGSL
jgi:hypothetical protein